jgi:hypothetical protein
MDKDRMRGPAARAAWERTGEASNEVAIDVWMDADHRGAMAFSQSHEPPVQTAPVQQTDPRPPAPPAPAPPPPAPPAPPPHLQTSVRQPIQPTTRPTPQPGAAAALAPRIEQIWRDTRDRERIFDLLRAHGPVREPAVDQRLGACFAADPDDLWLAQVLLQHGSEPSWPDSLITERHRRAIEHGWAAGPGTVGAALVAATEVSQPARRVPAPLPVRAFFFPGATDERALVIGGVHGSEQGGIEVVEMLLAALRTAPQPYATLIVVPALFPGYAARREREGATPTNRNFPLPGTSLASATDSTGVARDELARPILSENLALLRLIERFRPARICTVHGTQARATAGVFSDLHTVSTQARQRARDAHPGDPAAADAAERALVAEAARRTAADQHLALHMARAVGDAGHADAVRGNHLDRTPTCTWPGDVGGGTSLGAWGPQDISEGGAADRASISILTVEVPGNVRSLDLQGSAREARRQELLAFCDVIREVFLGPGQSSSASMSGAAAAQGAPS